MKIGELKPFAMDYYKKSLVVFRLNRGEDLDAFIFVYPLRNGEKHEIINRSVFKIGTFRELELYSKWLDEPMDVSGDFPPEIVDAAFKFLSEIPEDAVKVALEHFNEQLEMHAWEREHAEKMKNDPEASDYSKMTPKECEQDHLRMVEVAKKDYNDKIWFY